MSFAIHSQRNSAYTDKEEIGPEMKFSNKDFFSKCDQIRSFLRIRSNLMKKSSMEIFLFSAVEDIGPAKKRDWKPKRRKQQTKTRYKSDRNNYKNSDGKIKRTRAKQML